MFDTLAFLSLIHESWPALVAVLHFVVIPEGNLFFLFIYRYCIFFLRFQPKKRVSSP
jgi:hypothetical protein